MLTLNFVKYSIFINYYYLRYLIIMINNENFSEKNEIGSSISANQLVYSSINIDELKIYMKLLNLFIDISIDYTKNLDELKEKLNIIINDEIIKEIYNKVINYIKNYERKKDIINKLKNIKNINKNNKSINIFIKSILNNFYFINVNYMNALIFLLFLCTINRILYDQTLLNIVYSLVLGILASVIIYKLVYKKLKYIFLSEEQVFDYIKLILIASVALEYQTFIFYFFEVLFILTILSIFKLFNKKNIISIGYVFVFPLMWMLIIQPINY